MPTMQNAFREHCDMGNQTATTPFSHLNRGGRLQKHTSKACDVDPDGWWLWWPNWISVGLAEERARVRFLLVPMQEKTR